MNTVEIVCECCDAHMRLSPSLLAKLAGKTGRVTCKHCENKIVLDGRGDEVVVKDGGFSAGAFELEELNDFSNQSSHVDPPMSEFPQEMAFQSIEAAPSIETKIPDSLRSLPPPLPDEVRLRRSMGPVAGAGFEAPEPGPMRPKGDSLSPHSIDDEEEEGLVPLGREFNSSPFASERDETYNSLFPRPAPEKQTHVSTFPVSCAPAPPPAGVLKRAQSKTDIFRDDLAAELKISAPVVEQGPDGELINQTDKKGQRSADERRFGSAVPWAIAAVAFLALGISLLMDRAVDAVAEVPAASDFRSTENERKLASFEPESQVVSTETTVAVEQEETNEGALQQSASQATQVVSVARKSETSPQDEVARQEEQLPAVVLPPFSSTSAASALRGATAVASSCRLAGEPSGIAKVVVTFAPSGRVTSAVVSGPPYAGTKTGGCIASRFRGARIPAFSGEHVTVTKSVTIQ